MGLGLEIFSLIFKVCFSVYWAHLYRACVVRPALFGFGTARRNETEPLLYVGFAGKMWDAPAGALLLPGEEASPQIRGGGGGRRSCWGQGSREEHPRSTRRLGAFPEQRWSEMKWNAWSRSVMSDSATPWAVASFVHGIFQARILEWVVISFSDDHQVGCLIAIYLHNYFLALIHHLFIRLWQLSFVFGSLSSLGTEHASFHLSLDPMLYNTYIIFSLMMTLQFI